MTADIHTLEMEFAKSPKLDACLPLCAAYLAAKRYMEAMVVCKKGIKNAPAGDPRGRIMLARIYLDQGKLPKAQNELQSVLGEHPDNAQASGLLGRTYFEQGRKSDALPLLQLALQADPGNMQVRTLLAQLGPVGAMTTSPVVVVPATSAAGAAAPAAPAVAPPPPVSAPVEPKVAKASADAGRHVKDFFSPESLGFSPDEPQQVETAGPGRLTILGFVPGGTGSLKATALIVMVALCVAGAYIAWQMRRSHDRQRLAQLMQEVRVALDADRGSSYKHAIALSAQMLQIDPDHTLAWSAMAYAEAVLATDHNDASMLANVQAHLAHADQVPAAQNEFRLASHALQSYATHAFEDGLASVRPLLDRVTNPMVQLEAFRLMDAIHPDDKESKTQLRRLVQSVTSQARAHVFLGFYYYRRDDLSRAAKYFENALQSIKGHPTATLGRDLCLLGQGVGPTPKQKQDIEHDISAVLSLSPDDLTSPVQALALFTRSELLRWDNNAAGSQQALGAAVAAAPKEALFPLHRGMVVLRMGSALEASSLLSQAAAAAPNDVFVQKKLAEAQIEAGQTKLAQATLQQVLALAPREDLDVMLLQGQLAAAAGNMAEAEKLFAGIPTTDGAIAFARGQLALASAMRRHGNATRSSAVLKALLAKVPEALAPDLLAQAWCELGQAYESQKDSTEALHCFDKGIDASRSVAECHFYRCRLLGEGAEGHEACKVYLALQPHGRYAKAAAQY